MKRGLLAVALGLGMVGACAKDKARETGAGSAVEASGGEAEGSLCMPPTEQHEVSEYDTSGDGQPDVRKVFLRVGEGALARLVLVCRETDANADGVKDVVRFYNEAGEPERDEADANFDGKVDSIAYFERGVLIRKELDNDFDGRLDEKVFFERGRPLRSERDLSGRSTPDHWQPDRWEYLEHGKVVRMGTDVDGDGRVDRWDRDAALKRPPPVDPDGDGPSS